MKRVLAVFLSFVICICSLSIPENSMGVNAKSVNAETNETSSNSNEEIKDEINPSTIIDEDDLTPFGATKVTITFNANGGSVSTTSKSVTKGNDIGSMPTPTRTGYSFQGWYTSSSGGSKVTSSTKATKSMTVYAHWKIKSYTVTFNANGGSVSPTSKTVEYGTTISSFPTPTRTGYTFGGWSTSASGGSLISSLKVTKDQTLYANWLINQYKVTFNANGGKVSPTSLTYEYGQVTDVFPTPTREGYTFQGWYTSASGGTKITSLKVTKNQTIYAHWEETSYTVTFNANGGKVSTTSIMAKYDEDITLPTPTREGYKFLGWWDDEVGNVGYYSYTVKKSVTLKAHWQISSYHVIFNANGGTFTDGTTLNMSYEIYHNETIIGSWIPTPSRSGYSFEGWYTEEYGGTKFTSSTPITSDMTVYAHWSYIPSVTYVYLYYDANGGTVSSSYKAVAEGSTAGTLLTPTRTDYTFLGWFTDATGGTEVTSSTRIDYSMTIYAHWKYSPPVPKYTLTFNANGGSVSTSSKVVEEGSAAGTLPTPTRADYTFLGWFTDPTDGYEVTSSTLVYSSETLYAHWKSNTIISTITFNANGGSVSTTSKQVNCGDVIGTLPVPTRTGYTFLGWYTDVTNGSKVTSTTVINETALTLYAHWSIVKCTVTFNANGGTVTPTSLSVNYNDTIGLLPNPTREGYAFRGWFTSPSGGFEVTSSTKVTSNIDIYAQWTLALSKCVVNFDANGGTVTPNSMSVNYGSAIGTLPTPTRNGYTFLGWFTKASEGTKVSTTTVIKETSLTLYAHWSYDTIKVSVPQTLIGDKNGNCTFLVKTDITEGKITVSPPGGFYYKQEGKNDVYAEISTTGDNVLTKVNKSIKYFITCNKLSAGCWSGVFNLKISISN